MYCSIKVFCLMFPCSEMTSLIGFDLNIFLLQHKAIGIGHKFNNLDRPLPIQIIYT